MNFRLADAGWNQILENALKADCSRLRVVSPFIKERAARRLLEHGNPSQFQVITRFDLTDLRKG